MIYQRMAKEGQASAALALAETYGPPVLRKSNITGGVTSDIALAQIWYEKAKALGSAMAAERLEAVARLDKVTLILNWAYSGEHAYFFETLDKGYYRDAGVEVKIVRGQGSADAIRQVGAGNAMFGFADADIGARQRPDPGQARRHRLSQTAAGDRLSRRLRLDKAQGSWGAM
jgi:TPR repeat protein